MMVLGILWIGSVITTFIYFLVTKNINEMIIFVILLGIGFSIARGKREDKK